MDTNMVYVVKHPLVQHKLTLARRRDTTTEHFRRLVREIAAMLAYEATRDLPTELVPISTPVADCRMPMLSGRPLCLVSVLRAGNGMLDGVVDLLPNARVGHIGLARDPQTLKPIEYYFKVPKNIAEHTVIVVDPMLATGNSAVATLSRLKQAGVTALKLVNLVAAPQGVHNVRASHPEVPITLAAIDEGLNDHAYIVPGLGDAGDRIFGTV